jgi:putative transposase
MRYELVQDERGTQPVHRACAALCVSTSGFYSWRRPPESRGDREDKRLLVEIRASFEASKRSYGSPRVTKDLKGVGYKCSAKRVARIMRQNGLTALSHKRFRYTTDSNHGLPVFQNLLQRRFSPSEPDKTWAGDVTYIMTEEGCLYLAVMMDLYSRRIIGWETSERNDRYLALSALEKAVATRRPKPGLLHHTDRGSPYAADEYQKRLAQLSAVCSMSRKGDCYDNAVVESFFSSLKRERVHRRKYWSRDEARDDLAEYIDFYNQSRRHSHTGGISPNEFEKCHV